MSADFEANASFAVKYGAAEPVVPGITRVTAANGGPFTFLGTGTYIVAGADDQVAVVDPGPLDEAHLSALRAAVAARRVTHILVTHTHLDHSPAAAPLKRETGAPTYGFGPHGEGRLERGATVEAGADFAFVPDVAIADGDLIEGAGMTFECVHTPGHTSNHVCFAHRESDVLFVGDHVMGWNTTIVSPPDGNMAEYVASLQRVARRREHVFLPTHGAPIRAPSEHVEGLLAHRRKREAQILAALDAGDRDIASMVRRSYAELPEKMFPAAGRQMLASLEWLVERGEVVAEGELGMTARFARSPGVPSG